MLAESLCCVENVCVSSNSSDPSEPLCCGKMCKVQMLRALVKQRLTAAAEEICGLFERTIAEYEEELSRSKEENERQQKLLDAVFNPRLQLHRAVFPADVQQLLVSQEEVPPEQQEWSSSLDQEDPEPPHIKEEQEDPEPPHIKEEQEELWISQEGEQLQGLEEADIIRFTFTPVPVKSEDDEEKPQSSQLHQRQTEQMETLADGEDCGGPEPARNSDPDVQQLLVVKEEVPPEQQERSSSLDQEDPEPPHIKEEQEELWTSQEGEQLQGLEEADITKFPFTPVPVKSEDDEEGSQSSQLHQRQTEQMETEADEEDCGGPEPARNSDLDRHSGPDADDKTGDSSEPETDNSDDWKETREPQSDLNSLNNDVVPVSDSRCSAGEKPFSCSECEKGFNQKANLKRHMRIHTGEKPFSCSVCKKSFKQSGCLQKHMRIHTGEKPFSCSVCGKAFMQRDPLKTHMRSHTGEEPFSCSVCGKAFMQSNHLKTHMRSHTGENLFSCSVCDKAFIDWDYLKRHMRSHTGKKPCSCSVCDKAFNYSGDLKRHMRIHTGEKPFSCSVCDKAFTESGHMKRHMRTHTGEKPFSCSVCKKNFRQRETLQKHMRTHTGEKRFRASSQQLN